MRADPSSVDDGPQPLARKYAAVADRIRRQTRWQPTQFAGQRTRAAGIDAMTDGAVGAKQVLADIDGWLDWTCSFSIYETRLSIRTWARASDSNMRNIGPQIGIARVPCATTVRLVPMSTAVTRSRGKLLPLRLANAVRSAGIFLNDPATGPLPRPSVP